MELLWEYSPSWGWVAGAVWQSLEGTGGCGSLVRGEDERVRRAVVRVGGRIVRGEGERVW